MSSSAELRRGQVDRTMEDVKMLGEIIDAEIEATKTGKLSNLDKLKKIASYQALNSREISSKLYEDIMVTRNEVKQQIEDFLAKYPDKELLVTVALDGENWKPICNMHIDSDKIGIVEDDTKLSLTISNYEMPSSLVPDEVIIRYGEITKCKETVRTGETEDDILANVLEITYWNGTIIELGFLAI